MQENVGYTLNMAVVGSLEPYQAFVHHRMTNEVLVAGALNSEMRDKNVLFWCSWCPRTYGWRCWQFPSVHCTTATSLWWFKTFPTVPYTQKWVCGTTCFQWQEGSVLWQSPIPPDVLADRFRARQYTPAQPTSCLEGLGTATLWLLSVLSPTHFSEQFLKIQEYHTKKNSWVCGIPHT